MECFTSCAQVLSSSHECRACGTHTCRHGHAQRSLVICSLGLQHSLALSLSHSTSASPVAARPVPSLFLIPCAVRARHASLTVSRSPPSLSPWQRMHACMFVACPAEAAAVAARLTRWLLHLLRRGSGRLNACGQDTKGVHCQCIPELLSCLGSCARCAGGSQCVRVCVCVCVWVIE